MNNLTSFGFILRIVAPTILMLAAVQTHANELLGIRWNESPHNTRIVLDLSQEADFSFGQLDNPPRVFIDLNKTTRPASIRIRELDSRVLRSIRHAQGAGGKYRVVLDLATSMEPTVFKLGPHAPFGHRLVIDLPNDVEIEDCSTDTEPHEDVTIVIDAGHGGEDPGAIAVNRVYEKNITMGISNAVKDILDDAPGFDVVMTRTGDYEVPLDRRRGIAMQERAHLFVSIHADSFKRPEPRGASVYVLDNGKAQTELDRWLVRNENRSDWTGGVASWVNSDCFEDPGQYQFLNKMAREAVLDHSVGIGKSILQEISAVARIHPKGLTKDHSDFRVTDAGYLVLKNTQVPSVLVETGFLSNPAEAQMLAKRAYQLEIAEAIANGILAYFCDNPPWHTRLQKGEVECTYRRAFKTYRVQRGDTLGEIAMAYNVTVHSIKQSNELNNDRIYINQVLTIPARPTQN